MIQNEYGYDEILSAIAVKSLESALLFLESYERPLIMHLIGALSLIARTPDNLKQITDERFKNILRTKFLPSIYDELENIPAIFPDISVFDISELKKILTADLSADLLDKVSRQWQLIPPKYNHIHFYGITYLIQYLLELDLSNFEKWIYDTKRNDIQIVFLNFLLSDKPWNWMSIKFDNLDTSRLGILRACFALHKYKLSFHYNIISKEENINTIFQTRLTNKDKFIIFLKFLVHKYHGKKLQDLKNDTEFNQLIHDLLDIEYNFTQDDLFAESPTYYSPIYLNIIYIIQDKMKKQLFAQKLFEILLHELKANNQNVIETKLDHANILGNLAIIIDNVQEIEHIFIKGCNELSFPYSFCKVQNWHTRMDELLYFFISLVIYKAHKKESSRELWNRYLSIKSDNQLIIEINSAEIYKQIITQIEQLLI